MKVSIGQRSYKVSFSHKNTPECEDLSCPNMTTCLIQEESNGGRIVGTGITRLHPTDNFDREKGRQLSFKRALNDAYFPKDTKAIFYASYKVWGSNNRFSKVSTIRKNSVKRILNSSTGAEDKIQQIKELL